MAPYGRKHGRKAGVLYTEKLALLEAKILLGSKPPSGPTLAK
jgi:hypothetical protein